MNKSPGPADPCGHLAADIAYTRNLLTNSMRAIFTACSVNYLAKALALGQSVATHHPEVEFWIMLVDSKRPVVLEQSAIHIAWIQDLGYPDFLACAFKYNIIELNTAIKPWAALWLLGEHEKVLYLDPDTYVFAPLDHLFDALDGSSIILTPHAISPFLEPGRPSDHDLLRFGVHNLGFFGTSRSVSSRAVLEWWHRQCHDNCFYEPSQGLGVDQKWTDLMPVFFESVRVIKHVGCNLAFWNLHERRLHKQGDEWTVNGATPLLFAHFSSFSDTDAAVIAEKQTRHPPGSRPDFLVLCASYRERLRVASGIAAKAVSDLSYGFSAFSNGRGISPPLRRYFSLLRLERFPQCEDPFDHRGVVYKFARTHGLLLRIQGGVAHDNFKTIQVFSRQRRILVILFYVALRLLGPVKYQNLMRFLAHFSSTLNQAEMFKQGP